MNRPVRVLVVDDSALMRSLIAQLIMRDSSLEVAGTAMDGRFALEKLELLKPDVVTLDLEMPNMNGMETLKAITRQHRVPVIIVSAHSRHGASAALKALSLGAFDFVAKPQDAWSHMEEVGDELVRKIKAAARSRVLPRSELPLLCTRPVKRELDMTALPARVVAIGVSTGGPNALQFVLSRLPAEFPAAVLVVQHMPEGFTGMFARRLDDCCALAVAEARSGDLLVPGRVLISPGNRHMRVRRTQVGHAVVLADTEPVNGHRPSVDVLFSSVAAEFGTRSAGVIMTGMGEDGADGLGAIRSAGGYTLAQSEDSCVVFGMPRAAMERGHVMRVVHLEALAAALEQHCSTVLAACAR